MSSKYTKEVLQVLVAKSVSTADILRSLDLSATGSNYVYLKRRIREFEIDTSHFSGARWNKGRSLPKLHSDEILVKNRHSGRKENITLLRKAFLESGILEVCSECGIPPVWNGKSLRLQIDHRDGDSTNNEKENLRFLCPNCHTQTPNYGVLNINKDKFREKMYIEAIAKKERHEPKVYLKVPCVGCGSLFEKKRVKSRGFCSSACSNTLNTKGDWPSDEELLKLLKSNSVLSVARKIGVTNRAVVKRCKTRGIDYAWK